MTCRCVDVRNGLDSIQHWLPKDCIVSANMVERTGDSNTLVIVANVKQV